MEVQEPLCTLDELLAWEEPTEKCPTDRCVPPLQPGTPEAGRMRVLLCHDMAGGYLDDRFAGGVRRGDAYTFYNWQQVDAFVYFSHHLVTIPPPCWITAAHAHNVPVLGTFITEWTDGNAVCERVLSDEACLSGVVRQLVRVMQWHRFDGWLLNIENKIKPELVPLLVQFVRRLTEACHAGAEHSQVIWYDSVTSAGELKWQNELNLNNSLFFDVCDGIFLNYTWKEANLTHSYDFARKAEQIRGLSYDAADQSAPPGRVGDVYVGVDVWGRGCWGGGGFKTIEAVDVVQRHGLTSVAMFAQAWVYEKLGREDYLENEALFWHKLAPVLRRKRATQLPLLADFNIGQGDAFYFRGESVFNSPWTNISCQGHRIEVRDTNDLCDLQLTKADAFTGGSCLQIWNRERGRECKQLTLEVPYHTDVLSASQTRTIRLSYSWKCPAGNVQEVCGQLTCSSRDLSMTSSDHQAHNDWTERCSETTLPAGQSLGHIVFTVRFRAPTAVFLCYLGHVRVSCADPEVPASLTSRGFCVRESGAEGHPGDGCDVTDRGRDASTQRDKSDVTGGLCDVSTAADDATQSATSDVTADRNSTPNADVRDRVRSPDGDVTDTAHSTHSDVTDPPPEGDVTDTVGSHDDGDVTVLRWSAGPPRACALQVFVVTDAVTSAARAVTHNTHYTARMRRGAALRVQLVRDARAEVRDSVTFTETYRGSSRS